MLEAAIDEKEKRREYNRRYRAKNKDKIKADALAYKPKRALVDKAYRERNAEHIAAQRANYRKENREEIRARAKLSYKTKPAVHVLSNIKSRAKRLGVPFNITADDLYEATPEFCPVLGMKLERSMRVGGGLTDATPTVDRLVPILGYVKNNIVVVSHKANRIKNDATIHELEKVTNFYKRLFIERGIINA